jgi:hypothetical protein
MTDSSQPLRRLCRYYLACVANDDAGGVSVAIRRANEPEYVELPRIDLDAASLPSGNEKLADFVHLSRPRTPGTLRLGFPVFSARGMSDGAGRRLIPIFLIDLAVDALGVEPEWHTAVLNLEALRELEGNGIQFAQHALLMLEDGLGLATTGEAKPFSQVVERLKLLRPEWPWSAPASAGASFQSLIEAPSGLIYERAIVLRISRPYTQGLELELQRLAEVPEHALEGTALGTLLFGLAAAPKTAADSNPLLEVLPMNAEQRAAVGMGLTQPLSVIKGPPGTGKSQVVANLLINCTFRHRAVLFTSKNNKAVDVVDERVNRLGRRPVLVRLGSKEHRGKLAEHLGFLLDTTVTAEEAANLQTEQAAYKRLLQELSQVDDAERMALQLNEQLGRQADELTQLALQTDALARQTLSRINCVRARSLLFGARDALLAALPEHQSRWVRGTWLARRGHRQASFTQATRALMDAMQSTPGVAERPSVSPEADSSLWKQFLIRCAHSLAAVEQLQAYDLSLQNLRTVDFAELARRRGLLQEALVQTSGRLWQAWVTAQPAFLTPEQRLTLSRYSAVLKSVTETQQAERLPPELRREYDRITLEAPEVTSCFSVTALSARNRVPFVPGYFDVVVFDESSQCDIASALPILFRAKRAAIIGDPRQLRHISNLRRDRDTGFLIEHGLEKTHPDWRYSTQSLFELVAARAPDSGKMTLRDHHRSHPDVVGYSNTAFYDDTLRIVTRLPLLKRARSSGPALRWVDVRGRSVRGQHGSVHNPEEARVVVEQVKELLAADYRGSIGVVTPFAYQAERIRRELERDRLLWKRLRADHEFQAATAHGFQGDERDVMLFTVVAAAGLHDGAIRFLEDESNVFNVALTRARAELIVVADLAWCMGAPVTHLRRFAQFATTLARSETAGPSTARTLAPGVLTPEEEQLHKALEQAGIATRVRAQVEQYCVDLAVQRGGSSLAIDVVDRPRNGDWGAEALEREQLKRQRLLRLGWSVLRFSPLQVRDDLPWCVDRIAQWARDTTRAGAPDPT